MKILDIYYDAKSVCRYYYYKAFIFPRHLFTTMYEGEFENTLPIRLYGVALVCKYHRESHTEKWLFQLRTESNKWPLNTHPHTPPPQKNPSLFLYWNMVKINCILNAQGLETRIKSNKIIHNHKSYSQDVHRYCFSKNKNQFLTVGDLFCCHYVLNIWVCTWKL